MGEELTPIAARLGKIRALPVTTSSVPFDLTTSTEIIADVNDGRFIRMQADGCDVYYAFSDVTGAIDKTITAQANTLQCDVIPSGQYRDVRIPYKPTQGGAMGVLCSWLMLQGSAAGFLRISLSSESPRQRL